ncbi:MAG TPA: biliverdin-producing heme oxygenase [Rhizomicrobium sp.]|nr:biliverdin-producing heme oxygenase [Rhizomicrobium sp.]
MSSKVCHSMGFMNPGICAREFLRDATREQHALLDAVASGMRLDTAAGYAHFLATQASVLIPLERSLEKSGIGRLLPDWAERRRTAAMQSDLSDLHVTTTCATAPMFESEASLLGAAYVLEGSRLGARMVLKQIGRNTATRFLRHGEGSRLWQSFLEILEANDGVRRDPENATGAARRVFSLFIDAMAPRELVAAE